MYVTVSEYWKEKNNFGNIWQFRFIERYTLMDYHNGEQLDKCSYDSDGRIIRVNHKLQSH